MKTLISNEKDLNAFIEENGDYNPEASFLSVADNQCFVITGCTYASEAFKYTDALLICTENEYREEIENQLNAKNPELAWFAL